MNKPTKAQTQPYETKPFTLGLNSVKQLFAVSPGAVIGLMLISLGISVFNQSLVKAAPQADLPGILLRLGFIGLTSFASLAGLVIALRSLRGEPTRLADSLDSALENYLPYLGYIICLIALVAGGLLLLVIPGILFSIWYGLVLVIRVDEGPGKIRDAFRRSRTLVRGRELEFIAINTCAAIFSGFGILGPAVQNTVVVAWYNQLKDAHDTKNKLPPVSRQSKVVAGITILVLLIVISFVVYAIHTGALSTELNK